MDRDRRIDRVRPNHWPYRVIRRETMGHGLGLPVRRDVGLSDSDRDFDSIQRHRRPQRIWACTERPRIIADVTPPISLVIRRLEPCSLLTVCCLWHEVEFRYLGRPQLSTDSGALSLAMTTER